MNSSAQGSMLDGLSDYTLCFYTNITSQVQIIKITNIPNYYWEKAVFPGQQLIFKGITSACLEIYTSDRPAIASEIISCQQLQIVDELVLAKSS